MVLENVSLPYYTEKEDKANSISQLFWLFAVISELKEAI